MRMRQPIITFVGHIDHGKTSLQDYIRHSSVVKTEAGLITQHIGCSNIPLGTVKKLCGALLGALKLNITIPGLLFIDTPGHAAFTNLRRRGGNLADIAVLVIDINEGVMQQTLECIDILKQYKTPFVVVLNKIDMIPAWKSNSKLGLLENVQNQNENIMILLEKKLYEVVGKLSELGFNAERFDRVEDYTKQIAIIPTSAKTSEGLPELLMVIAGLSQRFLEESLKFDITGNAKGTVLEVKEEKGLGKTIDVILYDGKLKKNDIIVIGSLSEPITTKVKVMFEPMPLAEMRDKKAKFKMVNEIVAATGVKISAPDLDEVIAGMPLRSCLPEEVEIVKDELRKEVQEVVTETDKQGIVIKADSLGSLEALAKILKEKNIDVKKSSIGNISKKDISDAEINFEKDPLQSVVLGFNAGLMPDVNVPNNVKVFSNNIIYKLIGDFEKWQQDERKRLEARELEYLC